MYKSVHGSLIQYFFLGQEVNVDKDIDGSLV
jgi:hypothetical protein